MTGSHLVRGGGVAGDWSQGVIWRFFMKFRAAYICSNPIPPEFCTNTLLHFTGDECIKCFISYRHTPWYISH